MNEKSIEFFRNNKSWNMYNKDYNDLHHMQKEKVNNLLLKEGVL